MAVTVGRGGSFLFSFFFSWTAIGLKNKRDRAEVSLDTNFGMRCPELLRKWRIGGGLSDDDAAREASLDSSTSVAVGGGNGFGSRVHFTKTVCA